MEWSVVAVDHQKKKKNWNLKLQNMNFKFCPKCGGKLKKENINLLICQKCGFDFYQNPKACMGVIMENKKGQILMVKRKFDPFKGTWDLPGGFIENNETAEEATRREIFEELGLRVKSLKYLSTCTSRYLYKGINFHTLCFMFFAKINKKPKKTEDDISEAKFFDKDKIPYDNIAFKTMVLEMKKFI